MMSEQQKIETSIRDFKDQVKKLDDQFIRSSAGVAQAVRELRVNLDKVDKMLNQRRYADAAQMGYEEISSSFIWLQRELGGLNDVQNEKDSLIGEIAVTSGVGAYEKVEPYVSAKMVSSKVSTR